MRTARPAQPGAVRGFTLTELAVVMAIVAFLLGSLMYTLSAQVEQRNFEETRRRLELARELLLSFAITNGRLPCPARSAATATAAGRTDESANLNGDRVFVYHTPTPSGAANGEFDDQFTWITVGELYGKLIAAGVLP